MALAVSTTLQRLFIVETSEPFSTMEIQFVPPTIGNSRDARLNTVAIVGRNDDILHYSGGSESLKLELDFYAGEDVKENVIDKINWLKSLTMNDGYSGAFRNVKLVFGKLFLNEVWAIKSVDSSMSHFSEKNSWLPLRAKVQLALQLDPEKNRYIEDVRNGR